MLKHGSNVLNHQRYWFWVGQDKIMCKSVHHWLNFCPYVEEVLSLDGLKSLESTFNCEPESKLVQKVWSEELKSLKGEGFNLFLFQGLCVDDAQGQRRLGIELLDGSCNVISTPTSQPWSPPQPTLVTTYNTTSGNPEPWIWHRI